MKVLLFDIDGTLILSGGAGLRAMNKAFIDVYQIDNALEGVNLAGRTDTSIILDTLEKFGIGFDESVFQTYKQKYYEHITDEIEQPGNNKCMMPGIKELVPKLAERQGIYLGLLTGNWEQSGRIKIGHFGLNEYFSFGAFADDSGIRNELLPFAVQRFTEKYDITPSPDQVYVIGDTPADINCAKPHQAVSVAVAAAHYSTDQLAEHGPDHLYQDLSDIDNVLKVLG